MTIHQLYIAEKIYKLGEQGRIIGRRLYDDFDEAPPRTKRLPVPQRSRRRDAPYQRDNHPSAHESFA